MMTCDDVAPLLAVRAEIGFAQEQQLQAHLNNCPTCAAQWSAVRQTRRALERIPVVSLEPPAHVSAAIAKRLRRTRRPFTPLRPVAGLLLAAVAVLFMIFATLPPTSGITTNPDARPTDALTSGTAATISSDTGALSPERDVQATPAASFTVLVLGSDARPGQPGPIRTDSVLVVRVDREQQKITAVVLPRDLWVTYPNGEQGRLNNAYAVGEQQAAGGGAAFARQTVRDALGTDIDYVALVNFGGFTELIDRLGGITVNVPQALDDPRYPTDDFGTMRVQFAAGVQRMDGARALQYVRMRNPDDEFGRIARQRQVVEALIDRLQSQGQIQQLTGLADLLAILGKSITTDLPPDVLLDTATWAASLPRNQIEVMAVDQTMIMSLPLPATLAINDETQQQIKRLFAEPR